MTADPQKGMARARITVVRSRGILRNIAGLFTACRIVIDATSSPVSFFSSCTRFRIAVRRTGAFVSEHGTDRTFTFSAGMRADLLTDLSPTSDGLSFVLETHQICSLLNRAVLRPFRVERNGLEWCREERRPWTLGRDAASG